MASHQDRLLRALRRQPVDRTPVWFMRQAGRYLPEYRERRGGRDVLETCKDAEEAAEITLQPLRRMPLDAAILFSDIMVPLAAVGVPVRIEPGRGPIVDEPIRDSAGVARLRPLEPEADVGPTLDAVRFLAGELDVPLIGFAGGPFTLASYLVEGGPSRSHAKTKALMLGEPDLWEALMLAIVAIAGPHLRAQVAAGCSVVQIFDSWAGSLSPAQYERHVRPHTLAILEDVRPTGAPIILFAVGAGHLLELMADADAAGLDHRVPLDQGWQRVGGPEARAIQGNLDPTTLLAPWPVIEGEARDVTTRAAGRDGHVFNLGHGVLPDTPVGNLQRLVDLVHEETERSPGT